ncbi:Ribosomal large subunit pseudouridine synthase B [Gammaproteobacteria bacterium]|nr:pseudouridine synthase [Gammaproteobacteria bacterium]CAG0943155.1 Ribosomal large subunit pseudouridine synthase B [Gammaproteobacteria bacterium]
MAERLQKFLAAAGLGSRREIEGWIAAGRLRVNGKLASLGQKVSGSERITLDGQPLRGVSRRRRPKPRAIVYHKPVGEVCTRTDPEARPTVFQSLPRANGARWISVGRLDIDTSGLLLFTTDGELAHALMHPSSGLEREYAARVRGVVTEDVLRLLCEGLQLDDGPGRFASVTAEGGEGANRWYKVCVAEGRNRIVRRLWEAVGCQVSRLIRVRFGPVRLPRHLPRGRFAEMSPQQLAGLYAAAGLPAPGADAG